MQATSNRLLLYFLLASLACFGQTDPKISKDSIVSLIATAEKLKEEFNYKESMEIANIALTHAKINGQQFSEGYIYNIIGQNYLSNGETKKAIHNFEKALASALLSKENRLSIVVYNILGNIYLKEKNGYDRAKDYFKESYQLATFLNDNFEKITPLLNLATIHLEKKEYSTAHDYLLKANKHIRRKGNNQSKSRINNLLAKYFLHEKSFKKVDYHIKRALDFGNRDNLYLELANAYKTNSQYNYARKRYKTAYRNLDKHYKYVKKVDNETRIRELGIANIKFKVEEYKRNLKQAEIEVVKRNSQLTKWRITIVLGSILILFTLAFLITSYRNNAFRKKANKDLVEKNKELRIAKDAAEQVSELKSQFISTVSHELRTPLYGVIGLTTLLMENPPTEKRKEYLESLKFSGDYLLALINDVLQLSKIETKEVKLEKVSFNLRSLVEGIVNSLQSKQKHNNNEVHIKIDPTIAGTLIGDSIRISQILMNLVGNALKFTKNGNIDIKVLHLSFTDNQYTLRFEIQDDGIGIPKEKQDTIFENFAQAESINEDYQGTGLGLAIVEKLIKLHGSMIHLESEIGVGSKFFFDLVLDKAKEQQKTADSKLQLPVGSTHFNVLVVDDNKINQIVTQNILKKQGHTCAIASDGLEAIEKFKEGTFDLILMDINMPGMNGMDATKEIRKTNKHIPIIALTAVEEGEVRDQVIASGMNDLIVKPYDTQQFFQSIIKNVERSKTIV